MLSIGMIQLWMPTMPYKRGDVVLVTFPQPNGPPKPRPALIVDSDQLNTGYPDNVAVMITSQSRNGQTFIPIPHPTPSSTQMGVIMPSTVVAHHMFTVADHLVIKALGTCPQTELQLVDDALRFALDL